MALEQGSGPERVVVDHEGLGDPDPYELFVYRVEEGLGNACAVRLPDGRIAVVDWGTRAEEPLKDLLALAEAHGFAFIAATHAHEDHTLGLAGLMEEATRRAIRIECFVFPESGLKAEHAFTRARQTAAKLRIPQETVSVRRFSEPTLVAWGGREQTPFEVRVLAPPTSVAARLEAASLGRGLSSGNQTSLVLLFRYLCDSSDGRGRLLLTGDATPDTLQFAREQSDRYPELALDNQAFVVPHHGSSHNLPDWMDQYIHGSILISAPTDSLQHPKEGVLRQLASRIGAIGRGGIYCTSYAGACRRAFSGRAGWGEERLVQPGPCFGNLRLRVPHRRDVHHAESSAPGLDRRRFGHCGTGS